MLFLTGADHGYCEKEKRTRQNNLQSATVSLQVVIGLQAQRNGGSENQSCRFKWACQIVCSTTAFFLLPSSGRWYLYLVAD